MLRLLPLILLATTLPARAAGLGNTFAKLKTDHALTIGYFGGSITAGSGASKPDETSYRALTTKWFQANYPQAKITAINAAIGGTGSDLGAFRCQQDLLSKKPDLVFVEYAVNDGGGAEDRIKRSMEGIVRQILRANPRADIVFIYTTTKSLAPAYDKGEDPRAVQYDHAVAAHYAVPEVNVGKPLWQQVHDGKETWESLTKDNVHPNDKGYAIYADTIAAFLDQHRSDPPEPRTADLPKPLTDHPIDRGALVDATTLQAPGWQVETKGAAGFGKVLASATPGSELTFNFTGPAIGLFWVMGPDSGDVEYAIDNAPPKRRSAWDKYCLTSTRKNYAILDDRLPDAPHTLKLKILPDKNDQSKGTAIRIGSFMVEAKE